MYLRILSLVLVLPLLLHAQRREYDKIFFANSLMKESYFYTQAFYEGSSWIKNLRGKLPVNNQYYFTAGNSIELAYVSGAAGRWTASILYRELRGMDELSSPTHLSFRLYAARGTELSSLPLVSVGKRRDSTFKSKTINLVDHIKSFVNEKWITVEIPLDSFGPAEDIKRSDVILFSQGEADNKEHQLYIDQIEFVPLTSIDMLKSSPRGLKAKAYEKHIDLSWDKITDTLVKYVSILRSSDNKNFVPVAVQSPWINRYADFVDTSGRTYFYRIALLDRQYRQSPSSSTVQGTTRPMTDEQLLDMVQEAHFRYYWEGAEPVSGLALENIPGRHDMVASGASGFGIAALVAGASRKFISRDQLIERLNRIVTFLERADKFHGAFSHFIDGPSGKVEPFFGKRDNGGDLVETSFLAQGLITAMEYLDNNSPKEREVAERINKLWRGIEWSWYRREADSKFLLWHWSPDQAWVINHKLIGWNETLITYFLAIASPAYGVPADMYYSGWASQSKEAQEYRSSWGQTKDGSMFTNGNAYFGIPLPVGVSNGGPLFFVHYSFLGLDPKSLTDRYTNYFINNKRIALINYRYCIQNPENHQGYGKDAWGLTASDGLWGYSADEPVPHADNGKITPTGALASFPYTPAESMAALKNYYRNYGKFLWGEYGFRDAFNLDENWCSEIYMGLNQAPVVVMIENYRTGLLWKMFMKNEDVQRGLSSLEKVK